MHGNAIRRFARHQRVLKLDFPTDVHHLSASPNLIQIIKHDDDDDDDDEDEEHPPSVPIPSVSPVLERQAGREGGQ